MWKSCRAGSKTANEAHCNSDRRLYPVKTYHVVHVPLDHCSSPPLLSSLTFTYCMPLSLPNTFKRNFLSICHFFFPSLSFSSRAKSIFILFFPACVLFFLFCWTPCSPTGRSPLFFLAFAHCPDLTVYISNNCSCRTENFCLDPVRFLGIFLLKQLALSLKTWQLAINPMNHKRHLPETDIWWCQLF